MTQIDPTLPTENENPWFSELDGALRTLVEAVSLPDSKARMLSFHDEQILPRVRPLVTGNISFDRFYPIDYTGAITVNYMMPKNSLPQGPGTLITIADPPEVASGYRGLVFGTVAPLANPTTYRVQGGKITDAFYPFGPPATPDDGGNFAVDLTAVETWRAGAWAFRLELASAPGVAVGGLWPHPSPVYTGVTVELHEISDNDSLSASTPANVSGQVTFLSSTPGIKRALVRYTDTGQILYDTMPITGNLRSFLVASGQPGYGTGFEDQSYVYDQAMALAAAVATGRHEQAATLMEGLARLQSTTGPQTGGFRFSGRQGSAEYGDPAYRTGAHALAVFAALAFAQAYPQAALSARAVATAGLTWMQTQLATSGNRQGLYLGGVGVYVSDGGGGQSLDETIPIDWASTEHNIDAYFALKLAGKVLSNPTYTSRATALADVMWAKLWNPTLQRLNQGLGVSGPDTADPLDVHSWGSLWLKDYGKTGEAINTMSVTQLAPFKNTVTAPNGRSVTGYATSYDAGGYPGMIPNVWWEGTFSVAYALLSLGDTTRWAQTYRDAAPGQFSDGSYPYVALHDTVWELVPYRSVASTAWGILAAVGGGIFDTGAIPAAS